jgi:predicted dehydrogenase
MSRSGGFTSMAGPAAEGNIPEIGVAMLGYAFMGKAHSNAFRTIPYMIYPPPAIPRMVAIAGRNADAVNAAAVRYGYEKAYTSWREAVEDPAVQMIDNGLPNDEHAGPAILAAQLGKHILSEKPLGRTAQESKEMWDAVEKAGVKHMVAFNYRFVPAIRQIRYLIDSGALGKIYHFRAVYLQEWIMPHYNTPMIWRLNGKTSGSGALGDLGAHIIDLAHYLVGGISGVGALTRTFIKERPYADGSGMGTVDVDDAFVAAVEFENGAIGSIESSRFAAGRKNYNSFEINAEKATIRFNMERLNEMEVFWVGSEPKETQGFTTVNVSEGYHPWWNYWWPQGHIIGWEHTFIHEIAHFLDAIANGSPVGPHGATFEDGYRAAVIGDAILESAASRRFIDIKY